MFSAMFRIMKDEWRKIVEEKLILAVFVGTIILYGAYYPQPYTTQVLRDAPIGVVDLDDTSVTRQITRDIDASADAEVVMKLPDVTAAKRALFERKITGYVYFPEKFEERLLGGQQSPLAFYGDAAFFLVYSQAFAAVSSAAQKTGVETSVVRLAEMGFGSSATAVAAPITANFVSVYNPAKGYNTYVVPAAFLLILQQILLMGVGFLNTFPRQNESVSEINAFAKTTAKLMSYSVPAVFLYFMATTVVPAVYGVPRIGGFWAGMLIAVPYALSIAALGLIFAAIFKKPLAVQMACNCLGMPFFFIAGIPYPAEVMPDAFRLLIKAVPSSTGIDATVRVNQMGAELKDVSQQIMILVALSAVYYLLAVIAIDRRDKRRAADASSG
ncbi:ABC transporter permease [Palleronia caenipelagi]|uniref:ABC transporter permease n=1 Tax=Palleronia caenipelagi TaxID=2489174 RepID=A0A547QA99_9RHOB|nr:ABC transporter permease [Palleronia caenipelagi]TRD23294.1 ABC transporter permease [Palleronia caenipelagi]